MTAKDLDNYVNRIRNEKKRIYARAYLAFLRGGFEPNVPPDLSVMAAQAVRMRLSAMENQRFMGC